MPTDSILRDLELSRYGAVRLRALDEYGVDLVALLVATDCAGPRHLASLQERGGSWRHQEGCGRYRSRTPTTGRYSCPTRRAPRQVRRRGHALLGRGRGDA